MAVEFELSELLGLHFVLVLGLLALFLLLDFLARLRACLLVSLDEILR